MKKEIQKMKYGDIVLVTDLNRPGMVVSCYDIFEAQPAFMIRMVELDPDNGGKNISYTKRTLDKLALLPEDRREEAMIQLYVSPVEAIRNLVISEMSYLEYRYRNIPEPETVRDKSQRDAGYYEAMFKISRMIVEMETQRKNRSCAQEWYVARDDDGVISLFGAKPDHQDIIAGHHMWYRSDGGFRTKLPLQFLPDLASDQCCPAHVTIEMIK